MCNELKTIARTRQIAMVNHMLGTGSGEHNVHQQHCGTATGAGIDMQRDVDTDLQSSGTPMYLQPFVNVMVDQFKQVYPNVSFGNYMIEQRSYVMGETPFIGKLHDDNCDYTIICYYEIGSGIRGGKLNLFNDNNKLLTTYTPVAGSIKIFSGKHSVSRLYATAGSATNEQNRRSILTVFVNMHK